MALTCYFSFLAFSWLLTVANADSDVMGNSSICDTQPCGSSNYQCDSLPESGYRCVCSDECNETSCSTTPCSNVNEVCNMISDTDYECVCRQGCYGFNCSICLEDMRHDLDVCDTRPCAHDNQECIPMSETGYQCVCPKDCGGVDCSDCPLKDLAPTACSPNPCEGDCSCYESCKHAGGYYCRSDTGFLGKHCTVPVPELRCESDKIVLSVSESFVNEYDMGMKNSYMSVAPSLHEHARSECKIYFPTNGVYQVTIPLPFSACNTTSTRTAEGVVFTNQMWFNRDLDSAMFDMPIPAVEFQCEYNRAYQLVTSLQPVVSNPGLVVSKKDIFPTISLCKVPTCPNSCPKIYEVSGGASYTVGEMIHVTMSLDSGSLTTGVVQMYLSCTDNLSGRSVLDIVVDGCNAESGLPTKIRSSFVSDVVCVSFQTPLALQCTEFYVHAELMSCDSDDVEKCDLSGENMRCRSSRSKRSVPHVVLIGPISVINGSAGIGRVAVSGMDVIPRVLQTELQEGATEESSSGTARDDVVVLLFIAAVALTLLMLIPYAYVRSSRKHRFMSSQYSR